MRNFSFDQSEQNYQKSLTVPDDGKLRDWENKVYADSKRGAVVSDINPGDMGLLKQKKINELTIEYNPKHP